jgi:hypothetical protein
MLPVFADSSYYIFHFLLQKTPWGQPHALSIDNVVSEIDLYY